MKPKALTAAVLVASGTQAAAVDFDDANGIDPALMLYFEKPLDAVSREAALPSYGLRMNYRLPLAAYGATRPNEPRRSLFENTPRQNAFDLRFQQGQVEEVELGGMTVGRRGAETNNFGFENMRTEHWIIAGVAAGLGILCWTETWICEDGNNDEFRPPESEF